MVTAAKNYAIQSHQLLHQTYDGWPYTKHLEMVVSMAYKYIFYVDPIEINNVLTACWSHDIIEDTNTTKAQLAIQTNEKVAEIVFAVSNEQASSRAKRNIKTFTKIGNNDLAIFVKLCDRIANTTYSKMNSSKIYLKYENDFPMFKYFLQSRQITYPDMWRELEVLYK